MKHQIWDRLSLRRFLKLTLAEDVADSKTIWLYKEHIINMVLLQYPSSAFINELTPDSTR